MSCERRDHDTDSNAIFKYKNDQSNMMTKKYLIAFAVVGTVSRIVVYSNLNIRIFDVMILSCLPRFVDCRSTNNYTCTGISTEKMARKIDEKKIERASERDRVIEKLVHTMRK